MPVCYRVWVCGFSAEERRELDGVWRPRPLIAYRLAESADQAELHLLDSDRAPPRLTEAGFVPCVDAEADRTLHIGHSMPRAALWHVPRPLLSSLVLRTLDELVARHRPTPWRIADPLAPWLERAAAVATAAASAGSSAMGEAAATAGAAGPALANPAPQPPFADSALGDDLKAIDRLFDEAIWAAAAPASRSADRGLPSLASAPDEPAVAFVAGPAAVLEPVAPAATEPRPMGDRRRRPSVGRTRPRRRQPRRLGGAGASLALVVDAHVARREETSALLQAFGFRARAVASVAEAEAALWTHEVEVAFLVDTPPSPPAAVGTGSPPPLPPAARPSDSVLGLCQRIKQGRFRLEGRTPTKVVLVQVDARPADRVRARLAGCDHLIERSVARGPIALALEQIDLPMPRDPRREA